MNVLILGGRLYSNDEHVNAVLDFMKPSRVMGEEKSGAARLAKRWAQDNGVEFSPYSHAPDVVLAFLTSPKSTAAAADFARSGYRVIDAKDGSELRA